MILQKVPERHGQNLTLKHCGILFDTPINISGPIHEGKLDIRWSCLLILYVGAEHINFESNIIMRW